MPKKGCKKKSKNSNKIRRTVVSEAPPYLQASELSDLEMAESTEPVPDADPEDISEAILEAAPEPDSEPIPDSVFEPAPELEDQAALQSAPQSDPEPDSYLGLEEMDKAAEESTVKQHEVDDAPATGANEATESTSERAEIATEAPAILPEPVVEYAQPNTRWVGNDNPLHRGRANLRKIKSI
jgi:hypothetical protein